MLKIALTKGRIEKKAIEILSFCGYDMSELYDKGRKLLFHCPSTFGGEELQIVLATTLPFASLTEIVTSPMFSLNVNTMLPLLQ